MRGENAFMNHSELEKQRAPKSNDITFQQIWDYALVGNPFYLISAGLILYASTVISNTANILLETGIPVGILAGYTLLCAATVIFIVKHGVWSDARSLLFIILILPLVLSAGLDDKLLSTPDSGPFWLAGSILFSAGVFLWVKRGLGIRQSRGIWWVFSLLLAIYFLWPLLLSRLIIDWPDEKEPVTWGLILFPFVFSAAALPLLVAINRNRNGIENGTPWKFLSAFLFGLLGFAGALRSYLMTISFYPGEGVGGYAKMASGFSGWMLLPIVLVAAMATAEWIITSQRKKSGLIVLTIVFTIVIICLMGRVQESTDLDGRFYRLFWGRANDTVPPFLALLGLLGYMAIRRVKWAIWATAILLLGAGILMIPHYVTIPRETIEAAHSINIIKVASFAITGLITLLLTALAIRFRNRWVALALCLWLYSVIGGIFLYYGHPSIQPTITAMLLSVLAVGWITRDRNLEMLGLTGATCYFIATYAFMMSSSSWLNGAYLFGGYAVALLFLMRRYWIPAAIESTLLLFWGFVAFHAWISKMEIRGVGVIFWGLLLFVTAFLISLGKAGILQKKIKQCCGPLIQFLKEKS